MEIIRRKTDYGLRALVHMSRNRSNGKAIQAIEIVEAERIPEDFLRKVLRSLTEAGIVASHRGPGGGFILRRAPSEITILDVMEVLQGPVAMNRCFIGCDESSNCGLQNAWISVQRKLLAFLGSITITDLMESMTPGESVYPTCSACSGRKKSALQ